MTTKILALTDALGNLVRLRLMPGQRHDSIEVSPLIDGIAFDGLIAGVEDGAPRHQAFDSNALVAELNERGAKVVISQHPGRAQKLKIDAAIYTWHHLIENFSCKLKQFKRIAMRACKTDQSLEAMIYLAAAVINSRRTPQALDHNQDTTAVASATPEREVPASLWFQVAAPRGKRRAQPNS